jgi:RNA-directed DNA polymerase
MSKTSQVQQPKPRKKPRGFAGLPKPKPPKKPKVGKLAEIVEWNKVDWKQSQKATFKLQKRIYQASISGNIKQLRRLQKTMLRSWNAKLLATRQVTQDNSGKKTAGVDGLKSVTPKERLVLAKSLTIKQRPLPALRIYIPKPGKDELRPLSIPAMRDRALQALVKLALEPEWEARFEPNSYGFRPGRSAHDAIGAIFDGIRYKAKYVLDADISKCFDRINHNYLIKKLNTFPSLTKLIKSWLKAGWVFEGIWEENTQGTPQGGVISPLLANVALHGMEERLMQYAESWKGEKAKNKSNLTFVRYADDFVILYHDINVILKAKEIISEWLKEVGLEISEKKTSIRHTLLPYEDKEAGFDFLGFNVRQYPIKGKHNSGKNTNGTRLGFKTLIKPSKKKIQEHYLKIAEIIKKNNAAHQAALISQLNPLIRGWSNYYKIVVSKEAFADIDRLIWQRLWRWAERRHPNKSAKWVKEKYFHKVGNRNWVFRTGDCQLINHAETPIVRHVKVKGAYSPYNGDETYWATRMGKHPELPTRVSKLLKKQKGKCKICELTFMEGDRMEVDHITPKSKGGKNSYDNFQLLHRHCHDIKTAEDAKQEEILYQLEMEELEKNQARIDDIWVRGREGKLLTEEEKDTFWRMCI